MNEIGAALTANDWVERMTQLTLRQGVHFSTLQQKAGGDLELHFAERGVGIPVGRVVH
ncbi:MAG: hypothetical protein M3Q28_10940 [Pseudomonadota bacterium]|nr:hypothetical protein [Pseudomonadota bacterium]